VIEAAGKDYQDAAHAARHRSRGVFARNIEKVVLYALVIILASVFMIPFLWSLASSLKSPDEIYLFPPKLVPSVPRWANYARVFHYAPFGKFALNTLTVTAFSLLGSLISCTLVAFGLSSFRFPGRDIMFGIVLSTLILPWQVTMIPRYLMFKQLGWLDTLMPLFVPSFFATSAFNVFLLRQFFLTLPRELLDAAHVDGASVPRIYWSIILPLSVPALTTVAIFVFLSSWEDFIGPLIYLQTTDNFTLSLGLRYFQQAPMERNEPREHLLMAASLMMTLPCVLVFFAAQRYFVQGVVMTGLKG